MDYLLDEPSEKKNIRYAGLGIRMGAAIIDWIILVIFNKLIRLFITDTTFILLPISFLANILYFIFLESSEKQGTLGKMMLNIKVVNDEIERISIGTAILRFIIKKSPKLIFVAGILISGMETVLDLMSANNFSELYNLLGSMLIMVLVWVVASLVLILSIAFDAKKQGIHDRIAKTYVIEG